MQRLDPTSESVLAVRDKLAYALFEVVDAVAGLDRPCDLIGHGIEAKRAEEICELAALGRPK